MAFFDELMMKIGQGEKLNPADLEHLRQITKELDNVRTLISSWTQGTSQPIFNSPKISNPIFLTPALASLYLNIQADVTVTNGIDKILSYENVFGTSSAFKWDVAEPTIFRLVYPGQGFTIKGTISWASNATGYRNAKLLGYNSAGTLLGTATLYSAPGWAGADNVNSINYIFTEGFVPGFSYFKISVGQTSGGDLSLIFADIGLSVS